MLRICFLSRISKFKCVLLFASFDARGGIRERDGHHPADVLSAFAVPHQASRSEGFLQAPSDPQATTAEDDRLLPDDMVPQSRH